MKKNLLLAVALFCLIPVFLFAAEVKINVVFQSGSSVLRRDSMGAKFQFPTDGEAQVFLKACKEDFEKNGGKATRLRNLMNEIMGSMNFPQGFLVERYYFEYGGKEVWSQKLKNYWFMLLIEQDEKGAKYGNYYNCVEGWKLVHSTKKIVSFSKPANNWLSAGGPSWVPPNGD